MTDTRDQFHERESQVTPPVVGDNNQSSIGASSIGDQRAENAEPKVTIVFDCDVRAFADNPNPFHYPTRDDLLAVLEQLHAFVAVMIGRGANATIPEIAYTPIGAPVKVGEIMRAAAAAIAKATMTAPQSEQAPLPREKGDA